MRKTTGHIIKAGSVSLQGKVQLDIMHSASAQGAGKTTLMMPAKAQVVEIRPDYAVIEIICSCGAKTYLKCEYAAAQPSAEKNVSAANKAE